MKDYYKILGVEKNASKEEIKKAFRKLAHQHHPDKGGGEESNKKFKEASEAYSVLSDDNKRKQYDTFGASGVGAGGPGSGGFGGFNPNDFGGFDFSGFQGNGQGFEFDLGDIFGDLFGGNRGRSTRQARGRDISIDLSISFEESIFGVEKDITITKSSTCITCGGKGAAPHSGMETCKTCNGKGKLNETRRSFMGVFSTTRVCDTCKGQGQIPKEKCSTCHGDGVTERRQEIGAKIPAGIENGEMIRLNGMGEAIQNGMPGDLYVKIHVKPHPYIKKEGLNLTTDLRIKLTQAIMGTEITMNTLDGELAVKIPEGTNNGEVLRIKGKGVPIERGRRGDFFIKINVEMPKKLSKEAKKLIDGLRAEGL